MNLRTESKSLNDVWDQMYYHTSANDTEGIYRNLLDALVLADQAIESLQNRVKQLEDQHPSRK